MIRNLVSKRLTNNAKIVEIFGNKSMYLCIIFHKKERIKKGGVHMDKNLKGKFREVFRKEGFYIALFLCLCIIVTVGTISYKKISSKNITNKSEEINKEITLNVDGNGKTIANNFTNEMPNAERVQNETDSSKKDTDKEKKETSKMVATTTTIKFLNPIDGIKSRSYTYPTPVKIEEGVFRTIRGINIDSKVGTDVKAAAEGVVSLVENSGVEEGMIIEIKHANGLKTRYGNLDPNVLVKQGDKVNAKQVIAKVGDTAKVFDKETFGEFLNVQVINANGEQVNPEKYFTLENK